MLFRSIKKIRAVHDKGVLLEITPKVVLALSLWKFKYERFSQSPRNYRRIMEKKLTELLDACVTMIWPRN